MEPQNIKYSKIMNSLRISNISGWQNPIYSEVNKTHQRAYINTGNSTIQFTMNDNTNETTIIPIHERKNLLVPMNIIFDYALIPVVGSGPTPQDVTDLETISTLAK